MSTHAHTTSITHAMNTQQTYRSQGVHNGHLVRLVGLRLVLGGHQPPQLVQIDLRAVELVHGLVEVAHTNLAKVPGMVLVHVDAVVVLAAGETATSRMLSVLADTAVTGGHVAAELAALLESGGLYAAVMSIPSRQ